MKKIFLAMLTIAIITVTSCKKDNETAPTNSSKSVKVSIDKGNVSTWD